MTEKEEKQTRKSTDVEEKVKTDVEELSPEDAELKENLELCVERLEDKESQIRKNALETLRTTIRSSTSSMTSVPLPLKFLAPHFDNIKKIHEKMVGDEKPLLADIVSVLAMTMGKEGERESLGYKLIGTKEAFVSWGHEYVRNLSGEIGIEFHERLDRNENVEDLISLVKEIIPFNLAHNGETEAVDLLLEVDQLDLLTEFVDLSNSQRVILYLNSCSSFVPEPEDAHILEESFKICFKFNLFCDAMSVALKLDDKDKILQVFHAAKSSGDEKKDASMQAQLALMLGRQRRFVLEEGEADETCVNFANNTNLSQYYSQILESLEILEPKLPADVFKSHLAEARGLATTSTDSARQNLASTLVNGLVNVGLRKDKLATEDEESKWLYKTKDAGLITACASLGLVHLWDVDGGFEALDKYLYSEDRFIKAGALLGMGVCNCGVRHDCDPALAMLQEHLENADASVEVKMGAILGLGLAYVGSDRAEVRELLLPLVVDPEQPIEVCAASALALGLVFAGSADDEVTQDILLALMDRDMPLPPPPETEEQAPAEGEGEAAAPAPKEDVPDKDDVLATPIAVLLPIGLGLALLGRQQQADTVLEALGGIEGRIAETARVIVEGLAYAGTGNVLQVQKLLHTCQAHLEIRNKHQTYAVLGMACIAFADEISRSMVLHLFDTMLQYSSPAVRRIIPLAIAFLHLSDPKVAIIDLLSKLSHDADLQVSQSAILAMGLVGAGSNHARLATMLRSLSSYYFKEPGHLFLVRLALGLLHLGKGTLTLSPLHHSGFLLNKTALAGLVATLFAAVEMKDLILGRHHYLLYCLTTAMNTRVLCTFNEEFKFSPIEVRVGQAVDIVGVAGKPKSITGFQTNTTPVLVGVGERAELESAENLALNPLMEGFVVCVPNPDFEKTS